MTLRKTGEELVRITSGLRKYPAKRIIEAGCCQLRDPRGEEKRLNRHYAVSGPSAREIARSCRSGVNPRYCLFEFFGFEQEENAASEARRVSTLEAQVKITSAWYPEQLCRVLRNSQRYIIVTGTVHHIRKQLVVRDDICKTTARVVNVGDRVEVLYDTQTCSGRLLGVIRCGGDLVRTYGFVPEEFVNRGGFAKVTIDVICANRRPKVIAYRPSTKNKAAG